MADTAHAAPRPPLGATRRLGRSMPPVSEPLPVYTPKSSAATTLHELEPRVKDLARRLKEEGTGGAGVEGRLEEVLEVVVTRPVCPEGMSEAQHKQAWEEVVRAVRGGGARRGAEGGVVNVPAASVCARVCPAGLLPSSPLLSARHACRHHVFSAASARARERDQGERPLALRHTATQALRVGHEETAHLRTRTDRLLDALRLTDTDGFCLHASMHAPTQRPLCRPAWCARRATPLHRSPSPCARWCVPCSLPTLGCVHPLHPALRHAMEPGERHASCKRARLLASRSSLFPRFSHASILQIVLPRRRARVAARADL